MKNCNQKQKHGVKRKGTHETIAVRYEVKHNF